MTCQLCGCKPSWCECTQEAYELHDLKEQIEQDADSKNTLVEEIKELTAAVRELIALVGKENHVHLSLENKEAGE